MSRRTQRNVHSVCIPLTPAHYAVLQRVAAAQGATAQGATAQELAKELVLGALWPQIEAAAVDRAREATKP